MSSVARRGVIVGTRANGVGKEVEVEVKGERRDFPPASDPLEERLV